MRIVSIALMLTFACSTSAAIQTFTDETAFKNALGSFETFDFDGFPRTDGFMFGDTFDFLNTDIPGLDFDNSVVFFGGTGGTSNSAPNVVLNADLENPIVINFDFARRGVGLFNTSLVDAERFEVFDVNDNLLGALDLPSVVVNFGGFISDTPIAKAVITPAAPTNGSIYIDDLTISTVPLPAAVYLLGAATVLIRLFPKRRD